MEIFVSWSGERSHAVAVALHGWLPKIINALQPWLSSADIGKGARWGVDVAARLNSAKAGIICLTQNNLHSDWILFEAGALSKTVDSANVCTFLIDLEPTDLEPPLSQFQATKAEQADILKLLKTLNQLLGENALVEEHISDAFEMCWPSLKAALDKIPVDEGPARPVRTERQLLEELLSLVRDQARPIPSLLEDDRDAVVQARVNKLIFRSGGAAAISVVKDGATLRFTVTSKKGPKYDISIPRDIVLEELEKIVDSQIPPGAETLPPAVDKTTG